MVACVQIQLNGPSRELGRLLSNMVSNMKLKPEINNVKGDTLFCFKCFLLLSGIYRIRDKISGVTFRARCICKS